MALFVLYGDGEAAGESVKKGRRKKERTEKRNRDEVQKISLPLPYFLLCFSPLVCSLFCRNSAATFSLIILCFHCIIYYPWSVFCWKQPANISGIRVWFKEEFRVEIWRESRKYVEGKVMASTSNLSWSSVQVPVFLGENYDFWCIKMKSLFVSINLWDMVESGYQTPESISSLTEAQQKGIEEEQKQISWSSRNDSKGSLKNYFPKDYGSNKS
jgi:hypothetical protein